MDIDRQGIKITIDDDEAIIFLKTLKSIIHDESKSLNWNEQGKSLFGTKTPGHIEKLQNILKNNLTVNKDNVAKLTEEVIKVLDDVAWNTLKEKIGSSAATTTDRSYQTSQFYRYAKTKLEDLTNTPVPNAGAGYYYQRPAAIGVTGVTYFERLAGANVSARRREYSAPSINVSYGSGQYVQPRITNSPPENVEAPPSDVTSNTQIHKIMSSNKPPPERFVPDASLNGPEHKVHEKNIEPPDHLICPITFTLMENPAIVIPSGRTYEQEYIQKQDVDPTTRHPIQAIVPDDAIKKATEDWLKNNPEWLKNNPEWLDDHPKWLENHPEWLVDNPDWLKNHPKWLDDEEHVKAYNIALATKTTTASKSASTLNVHRLAQEPPAYLVCPITHKLMEKPVVIMTRDGVMHTANGPTPKHTSSGITYDEKAILDIKNRGGREPNTGLIISDTKNNYAIKSAIDDWKSQHLEWEQQAKREESAEAKTDLSETRFFPRFR